MLVLEPDEKQRDCSLKAKCLLEQFSLTVVRSQLKDHKKKEEVSFLHLK